MRQVWGLVLGLFPYWDETEEGNVEITRWCAQPGIDPRYAEGDRPSMPRFGEAGPCYKRTNVASSQETRKEKDEPYVECQDRRFAVASDLNMKASTRAIEYMIRELLPLSLPLSVAYPRVK